MDERIADADRLLNGRAWHEFCDRLRAVGDQILQSDFPSTPRERADGFRNLLRQLMLGTLVAVEYDDPDCPLFFRYEDDVTQWGGPNLDNTYLRARVRDDATYRVTGKVGRLHDFIIQTAEGFMHSGAEAIFAELSMSELDIHADGTFDLMVSPERRPGNWLPLHPGARYVKIREYFYDWDQEEPAEFHIEKVGEEARAPAPLTTERMAGMLDGVIEWAEYAMRYWPEYSLQRRGESAPNELLLPAPVAAGVRALRYGNGHFRLAEDEALLIELKPPAAPYWMILLYTHWWESPDYVYRQCSLNGHQAHLDSDGLARIVIAHRDPGAPNWLDTAGYPEALIVLRSGLPGMDTQPASKLVKLDQIWNHLPESTPRYDNAVRRDQIARRKAHLARRFHR